MTQLSEREYDGTEMNEAQNSIPEECSAKIPDESDGECSAKIPDESDGECPAKTDAEPNHMKMECKKQRSYGSGVLTGILATLICMIVFSMGRMAADSYLAKRQTASLENRGAAVLTDSQTLRKLAEVQQVIETHYMNEVDGELLADYLLKGAAVGLDDPYANYYSAQELQSVLDSNNGEYRGIGVTLSADLRTGEISVAQVYEGSPAEQAGMQVDDVVKAVDGEYVEGVDLSDLVSLIKSKEDPFIITVYRPEEETELDLSMECGEVEISQVRYEMLNDRVGYICIMEFTYNAVDQFEAAVRSLQKDGMEKLIVDVRGNPGGLLAAVCDILDLFLDGERIVYTEDKDGKGEEYYAEAGRLVTCETAVLTDGYSASASEIFAGAIQDYGIGPVIGTQTYGKGVVQNTFSLSDGSAFKLTVEKYFTAGGQDIDGKGIMPDIIIEETKDARETEGAAGTETAETENRDGEQESDTRDVVVERAVEALTDGWERSQYAE